MKDPSNSKKIYPENIAIGIVFGILVLIIIIWNRISLGPNTITKTYEISKLKIALFCKTETCTKTSPTYYPELLYHLKNLKPTLEIGFKGEPSMEFGYLMLDWDGYEKIYIRFWSRQSIKSSIVAQFQHRGDHSTNFYGNYLGNDLFKFLDSSGISISEKK